jgi:hypothetical protein
VDEDAMSDTIVDMPKVTQMLDAGWRVMLFKNPMASYSALATHDEDAVMQRTRDGLLQLYGPGSSRAEGVAETGMTVEEWVDDFHYDDEWLCTDDFTPEQALTRLAYKAVGGEIL